MKDPNSASGLIWLIVQIVLRLHYNIKTSTVMQCWHRPLSLGFPASSAHVRSKLAVDVGVCSIGSTLPLASTLSLHSLQLDKRLGKRMDGIKKNQQQQPTHSGSWCIQHLLSVILKTVWGQSKYKYISLCHSPSLSHTHTNTHTTPAPDYDVKRCNKTTINNWEQPGSFKINQISEAFTHREILRVYSHNKQDPPHRHELQSQIHTMFCRPPKTIMTQYVEQLKQKVGITWTIFENKFKLGQVDEIWSSKNCEEVICINKHQYWEEIW